MSKIIELSAPDLAAMLCSRVCHDLINPIGAIGNGLQALNDPKQEQMKDLAQDLVVNAAKQSLAKLEFSRLAFGASSTSGTQFDTRECERVAKLYYDIEKADLVWNINPVLVPKNVGKLLMNMLLIASESVFRGGVVEVSLEGETGREIIKIKAISDPDKKQKTLLPANVKDFIGGEVEDVTAREIQPFYTGLLARLANMELEVGLDGVEFSFVARPK